MHESLVLRVHHPPLLKASIYNWQTWSPHLHPQDYVPSKSWGKHSSVRHCWFFERGCCKFGEHCPFSHKTWQKRSGKKEASHTWRVFFFRVRSLRLSCGGRRGKGFEQPSSASEMAHRDAWLLILDACVGWTTCSFWNMALLSSIHLPCIIIMDTIFDLGGLKRLRSNLVKDVNFATWCLLNSYLTRSPAQSPKSSPQKWVLHSAPHLSWHLRQVPWKKQDVHVQAHTSPKKTLPIPKRMHTYTLIYIHNTCISDIA